MTSPMLTLALAKARRDDFQRAADAEHLRRQNSDSRAVVAERNVTLRLGSDGDDRSLERLAALDSSPALSRPVLLAEVDGLLLAAISLFDGAVIADPFRETVDLVGLLRTRARQWHRYSRIKRCGRLRSWVRLCVYSRAGTRVRAASFDKI